MPKSPVSPQSQHLTQGETRSNAGILRPPTPNPAILPIAYIRNLRLGRFRPLEPKAALQADLRETTDMKTVDVI